MNLSDCVDFLQRLIRTESLPGREAEIARLVAVEMERLGYDRVWTDSAGNVIGLIEGRGSAPAVMLNTHLDHVDVGDHRQWPHPPFGGEIHQDRVWGRGAMDIKGPLAAQVYGAAQAAEKGPPGDVYVSVVVQEEVGGLGARHLVTELDPPLVVVGEATSNQLRRGHRGRTELALRVRGRSAHASAPDWGVNPHFVVARFLSALQELPMDSHPDLGPATVVPTLIRSDQTSPNVIPAEIWLTCDWRTVPGQTAEGIRQKLQKLAETCLIPGSEVEVEVPVFERVSYTGLKMNIPSDNPAFILEKNDPALLGAASVLSDAIGLGKAPGVWRFATDGGHFAKAGLKVIGFAPGEEELAHTVRESIPLAQLETGIAGNRALALEWASSAA